MENYKMDKSKMAGKAMSGAVMMLAKGMKKKDHESRMESMKDAMGMMAECMSKMESM